MTDVGKRWLGYGQPHAVQRSADSRVNLALHLLGERFFPFRCSAQKICNLSYLGPLRMAKTLGAEMTGNTGGFRALELGGQMPLDICTFTAAVHFLARRTKTEGKVVGKGKILGGKHLAAASFPESFLFAPLFVPVSIAEPGVTLS